jgi:hypothetical protein
MEHIGPALLQEPVQPLCVKQYPLDAAQIAGAEDLNACIQDLLLPGLEPAIVIQCQDDRYIPFISVQARGHIADKNIDAVVGQTVGQEAYLFLHDLVLPRFCFYKMSVSYHILRLFSRSKRFSYVFHRKAAGLFRIFVGRKGGVGFTFRGLAYIII